MILADYLAMLRSEWFVVFDRMAAALHFEVLPQGLNKENLVNQNKETHTYLARF